MIQRQPLPTQQSVPKALELEFPQSVWRPPYNVETPAGSHSEIRRSDIIRYFDKGCALLGRIAFIHLQEIRNSKIITSSIANARLMLFRVGGGYEARVECIGIHVESALDERTTNLMTGLFEIERPYFEGRLSGQFELSIGRARGEIVLAGFTEVRGAKLPTFRGAFSAPI